uniref:PDZ domain-containing protein n=1 Tax=Elaeophora elaphi TaxID=1147741 RepID=A0A158Q8Z7_9BILA
MADVTTVGNVTEIVSERIEVDSVKNESEKEDDSEKSMSSYDDFEIIGGQARLSEPAASDDGKSDDSFTDLFKKHILKRSLSDGLLQKRAVESAMLTCAMKISNREEHNGSKDDEDDHLCMLWKALSITTIVIIAFQLRLLLKDNKFERNEHQKHHDETLEETVTRQQQIIEKLENQLKSRALLDVYNLPVRVEEERATAFARKDGFNYFFVIMDWKKNDRGVAQQHLHLAFKQSNSSIYIYDHGPLSGRYFTVGDRIIDVDGIMFIRAADLRDRILWSHHNKDHFTSIIERPATEQALRTISMLLQPSLSSFSVVLSA